MKKSEIKKCGFCKKGVMHNQDLTFYRVTASRSIINVGAIQRQNGLEMFMGNAAIASVMGPDEDMAEEITKFEDVFICESCAMDSSCFASMFERLAE